MYGRTEFMKGSKELLYDINNHGHIERNKPIKKPQLRKIRKMSIKAYVDQYGN